MAAYCLLLWFLLSIAGSNSYKFWDAFQVTNVDNTHKPVKLPRTIRDAVWEGWNFQDFECGGDKGYQGWAWVHQQFSDTIALLFDENDYIAGMQARISDVEAARIGVPSLRQMPPFTKHKIKSVFTITLYFVEPDTICNRGRTDYSFESHGTGTGLYLQYGDKVIQIERNERDIELPWVKGKCYTRLGRHYWYNIYEYMNLDSLFPVVPIYNGGDLNGFGIIYTGLLQNDIYGHPPCEGMNKYVEEVPKCFDKTYFSMYYIFFTSNLWLNFC